MISGRFSDDAINKLYGIGCADLDAYPLNS